MEGMVSTNNCADFCCHVSELILALFHPVQFHDAAFFTGDISQWDVRSVRYFDGMFYGAALFDSDLSLWRTDSAESMEEMFRDAWSFRGLGVENFNVTGVRFLANIYLFYFLHKSLNFSFTAGQFLEKRVRLGIGILKRKPFCLENGKCGRLFVYVLWLPFV
jgi:Mycoplasma protein of unknown function, DUF285